MQLRPLGSLKSHNTLKGIIEELADCLKAFIGYKSDGKITGSGIGGKPTGKNGGDDEKPWQNYETLKAKVSSGGSGYYYSYAPAVADWQKNVESLGSGDPQQKAKEKCAKIFLSCLPIVFSGLSYIYWRCSKTSGIGNWDSVKLTDGDFYKYMVGMDYHRVILSDQTGNQVVNTALQHFEEFNSAATSQKSYAEFYTAIYPWSKSGIDSSNHPLSTLYLGASAYFTYQHTKNTAQAKPPTTIREMLYFLSGLQFSPHYSDLQKHIDSVIPAGTGLPVADSSTSTQNNVIKREQMKGFLHASCLAAPATLGWLQGPGDFNDEPWLYHLFCNGLNLAYPSSGPSLFNTLGNYTYALQFQLHFLYLMCSGNATVCCWSDCRFGKNIRPQSSGSPVTSHICHAGCGSSHTSGSCKHDRQRCGQNSNQTSPLQAFLTDNLKEFSRGHPSGHSAHLATCSGRTCHVPMGFTAKDLRGDPRRSDRIYYTLYFFCGNSYSPLRQLCEKLGCLTKRTPRNLGDIFGFVWHLNSQLFKSGLSADEALKQFMTSIGLTNYPGTSQTTTADQFFQAINNKIAGLGPSTSFKTIETALSMAPAIPFLYQLFMGNDTESLPVALFNLKGTDHGNPYSGTHANLFGLYNPQCTG
ncbi:variant erythrocyte surface antigen-1 family protein [Babesia caballi]|uniref:Variant erythrocyte surface antigen-1 family protein n=1 Tax=Babesia caballi TaxID=5871 RepID=A0AAV4LNE8_BABCB|nr:variant erythrocyte surface antigen-1 family protein [Babesia caballi]